MPRPISPILDPEADEVLTQLAANDSVDPDTKYVRQPPIEPHWACRPRVHPDGYVHTPLYTYY